MLAFATPVVAGGAVRSRRPATCARRTVPVCCDAPKQLTRFSIGDRVKVVASPMVMYHVSGAVNKPTDVSGFEGEVLKVVDFVNDQPITATKPVVVKFEDPKFRGHFDDDELELVS